MTTGMLVGAVAVSRFRGAHGDARRRATARDASCVHSAPAGFVLATEIFVRFHDAIRSDETQFASGVGHFLEAAAGIAILKRNCGIAPGERRIARTR